MTENQAIKIIKQEKQWESNARICDAFDVAIQAIKEVQAYRAIGTVEECRFAMGKVIPKKVDEDNCCPICHTYGIDDNGVIGEYCPNCGQKLDWNKEGGANYE